MYQVSIRGSNLTQVYSLLSRRTSLSTNARLDRPRAVLRVVPLSRQLKQVMIGLGGGVCCDRGCAACAGVTLRRSLHCAALCPILPQLKHFMVIVGAGVLLSRLASGPSMSLGFLLRKDIACSSFCSLLLVCISVVKARR